MGCANTIFLYAKETSCIYQTLETCIETLLNRCRSRDHDNLIEEVGGRAIDKNSNWKLININSFESLGKAREKISVLSWH